MSLFAGQTKRTRWAYPGTYDPKKLREMDRKKPKRKRGAALYIGKRGRVYKAGTLTRRLGKQIAGPHFKWLDPTSYKTHRRC